MSWMGYSDSCSHCSIEEVCVQEHLDSAVRLLILLHARGSCRESCAFYLDFLSSLERSLSSRMLLVEASHNKRN